MKTNIDEMNYKQLISYIQEINTELWQLKKACDKWPTSIEMHLYSTAFDTVTNLLDAISEDFQP